MRGLSKTSIMAIVLIALGPFLANAQEQEGQIKIKITREINGEQKTYEGSYESEDQMQADENLQEFLGEDTNTNIWFGRTGPFDSESEDDNVMMFRFDDEDGPHQFHFSGDDSSMHRFQIRMEELSKNLEGMDEEMEKRVIEMQKRIADMDLDFDIDFDADSMAKEIEVRVRKMHDEFKDMERSIEIRVIKNIEISDDIGDDFGKKGIVDEDNLLVIPDLNYFPNPSPSGRFTLRFNTPEEGELSIKIFNLDGKEVYSRYFDRFGGLFSESIDLSTQKEGMYLLEIQQEGKRLTRKIMVN